MDNGGAKVLVLPNVALMLMRVVSIKECGEHNTVQHSHVFAHANQIYIIGHYCGGQVNLVSAHTTQAPEQRSAQHCLRRRRTAYKACPAYAGMRELQFTKNLLKAHSFANSALSLSSPHVMHCVGPHSLHATRSQPKSNKHCSGL